MAKNILIIIIQCGLWVRISLLLTSAILLQTSKISAIKYLPAQELIRVREAEDFPVAEEEVAGEEDGKLIE